MIGERTPARIALIVKAAKKADRDHPNSLPIGVTKTLAPQTPAPLDNAPEAMAAKTIIQP
tara:strand:+ start:1706 stop:1885 length:180 start_codon:yes stop_codon:yes gene_type:complete